MKRIATAALVCLLAAPALADDVTDQINEALKAYEKKDLSTAGIALDAARKLIAQQQGEMLAAILPEPLSGWKARDAESNSAGAAIMGGGVQASRKYSKDRDTVTVTVMGNSPMLQAMSMMFANPMMTGGRYKLVIMDGQKVLHSDRERTYQMVVANKYIVMAKGNRKSEDDDVKAYFKAVDVAALEKLGM